MEKKKSTLIDLIKHLTIAIVLTVGLVYGFFNLYLPFSTNQGETITVPNLEGLSMDELGDFLEKRRLRYEVELDSGYSPKYPPLAVLKQFPLANSKVKENRKIYVKLNAVQPPDVSMPKLIGRSIKNAQLELKSMRLAVGEITYKSDFALNSVLEQLYKGQPIKPGDPVPKGSRIDLVAGDGLGNQVFDVPNLTGLDLEEAQFAIKGTGLKMGDVFYEKDGMARVKSESDDGTVVTEEVAIEQGRVFKQRPNHGKKTRIGEIVDIWIVEIDSTQTLNQPNLDVIEE